MTDSGSATRPPPDPEFRARVEASFDRQPAMKSLGARLLRVEPGEVTVEVPYRTEFTQQHGFMHAGALSMAMDTACGYAAFTLMSPDAGVLTVEFKVNFLAPAKGTSFRIGARVLRAGRTLTVCEAQAWSSVGQVETLVASMTGTIMAIVDRTDVRQ
jgi:uncharacterized protein (TIGR00369 family)